MKKIGIISDTHHWLDPQVAYHFAGCDEIWHGGDFGTLETAQQLEKIKPVRGVYGNIDGYDVRSVYPELNLFQCEGIKVMMIHIAGHPQRYAPGIPQLIATHQPQLFICGHSHILKIMYDQKYQCLHINPGAAGNQGWHKVRTIVRLTIDGSNMRDCNVVELGKRGKE